MKWIINSYLLVLIFFIGCVSEYQVPQKEPTLDDYTIVVNEDFDTTWTSIIEHASSTYFVINNYEKDSGLMTLDFGARNPTEFESMKSTSDFIDCGDVSIPLENYEGPFVKSVQKFGSAKLNGKMNIFVKPLTEKTTQVQVSARYVFTANEKKKRKREWVFNTGGKDANKYRVGSTKIVIVCQPSYEAEKDIIGIFK